MNEDYITKAIGKESVNYIGITGFKWMLFSIVVFSISYFFKIDGNICNLCVSLSNKINFIEKFANVSSFANGMRMQWLFLTFTSPIYFYFLLMNVNKIKHGDMSIRILILSIFIFTAFTLVFLYADPKIQEKGLGVFSELLRTNFLGSQILSFLIYFGITTAFFFIYIYIEAFFRCFKE